PISSFKNISSPQSKLMLDGDSTTYYYSGDSQKADSWIGIDLGEPVDVEKIVILQGRNSINDNDLFGKAVLETSIDGKDWQPLGEEYIRQYEINWQGDPVRARYVRLRCTERILRTWVGIRLFQVNPINENTVGIKLSADGNPQAVLAFDNNPNTTFTVDSQFGFGRKTGASTAILLLDTLTQPVSLKQYDSNNTLIRTDRIDAPFAKIELDGTTDRMVFEGPARIFEIIQK
ncbi:MAG: discoidin domain-containing protein, partial [Muribaculaceae bacterium]|nr:discoidin domain-containing protein [Muribaculaceae bacterium]